MKIFNCLQGSEEWDRIRSGKATASQFHRIITPKKLKPAAGAETYACELAAQLLGIASPPAPPSFWMDQGTEREQWAIEEFQDQYGVEVQRVGFVMPDEDCGYGCSPDGLIGERGLLEVKCPKAETIIEFLASGIDTDYLMQIQGQLWITGREACHLYFWHPELEPVRHTILRYDPVIESLAKYVPLFVERVRCLARCVKTRSALGIDFAGVTNE